MEENSNGKTKTSPSIPANYVSIRHLQERWINERDRKRKEEEEEEEKRPKQEVEKQPRIEDDLKKTEKARGQQRDEEKRLDQRNRKNRGRNRRKKEPTNGGDAKVVEKEEPELTLAIGSERVEAAAAPEKELRGFRRKRYQSKKKKNQAAAVVEDVVVDSGCGSIAPPSEIVVTEKINPVKKVTVVYRKKGEGAVVEDVVVDCGCGSIASPPEVVVTEKKTPVKDVIRVYRKKGEKATGNKSVEYREKAVTDDQATTAIETQFEDLSINKAETKNLKAQTRSVNRNRLNQGNDLVHQRVRKPIRGADASTMVWVKKEQNERAAVALSH